jgi:FdhD protein
MAERLPIQIHRYQGERLQAEERRVVEECPLRLNVNGRDLATLIASPHRLNFLIAGFLRLSGFITSLEEILSLGVCREQGVALVRLRCDLPVQLRPTITSGCGGGVSYDLTLPVGGRPLQHYAAEEVLTLMAGLHRSAERYAEHGGIHSAGIGREGKLLLTAEDLGRHNTLDRLAGEALFRGIDLTGTTLVTSGRVSSEMVIKAARLGVGLIASRTAPTDAAIALCAEAGIVLVGYLRGQRYEVYTHAERLTLPAKNERIAGITGVILAGGESRRMGTNKSLLPLAGARFIDHVYRACADLFAEVLIVTNTPGLYADLPCRKVADLFIAQGSLAGIHAGLSQARTDKIFVVACDMPLLNRALVRRICAKAGSADVVIPYSASGHEPLHALYDQRCLARMEEQLATGRSRIIDFFPQVKVEELPVTSWQDLDPQGLSFRNINTPEEYYALRRDATPAAELAEQQEEPGRQHG